MSQVGILALITEFFGAVVLGRGVTGTIKNKVMDIGRFADHPEVLILAFTCAELSSATWLCVATHLGLPVSTTQTIVGALIGAGIASQAEVSWGWKKGSVSQIAASWAISPILSCVIAMVIFGSMKYSVLERRDPLKNGLRAIPIYLSITFTVLSYFIIHEALKLDKKGGSGTLITVAIVAGVLVFNLIVSYTTFVPYFKRRLVKQDMRLRGWHLMLGPLLLMNNPPLFWVRERTEVVKDCYASPPARVVVPATTEPRSTGSVEPKTPTTTTGEAVVSTSSSETVAEPLLTPGAVEQGTQTGVVVVPPQNRQRSFEPEDRFLKPNRHLPRLHPRRIWGYIKYGFLQGVTRECVSHNQTAALDAIHLNSKKYDNRVQHLWTYAQVASAIAMSIAHGSNDVANAVGPWSAAYSTWTASRVDTDSPAPVWILAAAGFLMAAGFWICGYRVLQSMGNKITQLSPTRGYVANFSAAVTVLIASKFGIPVSTTLCVVGGTIGVGLMNLKLRAVNWKHVAFVSSGWVLTLPVSALISGLLMAMAVNAPSW